MAKSLKDFEKQVESLSTSVETLSERLDDRLNKSVLELKATVVDTAKHEAFQVATEIRGTVDHTIDSRFKTTWMIAAVLITLFGAFGYFGLNSLVSKMVNEKIGNDAQRELERISREAKTALVEIQRAQLTARANPVIIIQTDVGPVGPYMGTLMGVIYNVNPRARIQIGTSQIDSFDIAQASWTLWRSARFYPPGTIFVVITSPGGLTSQPVVLRTRNDHFYIGFDNGCFDFVVQYFGHLETYSIASPELTPAKFKDLFGGIDVFGPTAAKLSLGFEPQNIGPRSQLYDHKLPNVVHTLAASEGRANGTIMDIDKFGNATSNLTQEDLQSVGIRLGQMLELKLGTNILNIPITKTYGFVSKLEPVAIVYDDLFQLAINEGNFKQHFRVNRGMQFQIRQKP